MSSTYWTSIQCCLDSVVIRGHLPREPCVCYAHIRARASRRSRHALGQRAAISAARQPPKVTSMDTFFDRNADTQWGHMVMALAVGARDEGSYMRDPEAIRCHETGFSPKDIYLGQRQ